DGDSLWSRDFMILDDLTTGNIALVRDGGFVIASNRGMLRLSAAGDSLWVLPYRCTHCAVTAGGGYVLIGRMGFDNSDFFILKTDRDRDLPASVCARVAQDFTLHTNYPNPFNATTTIRFDVARAGDLTLSVFDMNGRLVRTLASGRFNAGSHTIHFDARNLSSGIYFSRLNTGGQSAIQKMVLLK
ncbi:T9SS C-terminal target domain-containing protein, partial [candidate division KSB1 bacterium]